MSNKDFFEDKVVANVEQLKSGIAKTHGKLVKVSDETIEGVLEAGAQWQNIVARSLKKGTQFLGTQQDLVFETFEGIKKIHLNNVKRIKGLADFKTAKEAVEAGVKATKNEVVEATKAVKAEAKAAKKEVKKEIKAAKKAVTTAKTKVTAELKDLKRINGIGPKLEAILNEAGIKNLKDLADTPVKKLEAILEQAGPRYKSFSPKEWLSQVKEILNNKG